MFYEKYSDLPFIKDLENNWQLIHDEVLAIDENKLTTYEHSLDKGWEVLMLSVFGERNDSYLESCPRLMQVLETIPNVTIALVSKLKAGSDIHLHTDDGVWLEKQQKYVTYNSKNIVRCHLALSVPEAATVDSCAFKIEDDARAWEQGKTMIFDCTAPHQAWNHTSEDRIVLIVDFAKDGETIEQTEDIKMLKQHLVDTYM